jgi:hypothetical protein
MLYVCGVLFFHLSRYSFIMTFAFYREIFGKGENHPWKGAVTAGASIVPISNGTLTVVAIRDVSQCDVTL